MIVKRFARICHAAGCRITRSLGRAERANIGKLVILCYHRVLPKEKKANYFLPDLVVTPDALKSHCATLGRRFTVLPLHEAVDLFAEKKRWPRPVAAVTFDDGYQDNFRYAAPILAENRIRATFFVVTDLVGTDRLPWYDRMGKTIAALADKGKVGRVLNAVGLGEGLDPTSQRPGNRHGLGGQVVRRAKELAPFQRRVLLERLAAEAGFDATHDSDDLLMDWKQLERLIDAGHEIGSHSRTHEILTQLGEASLQDEVTGSRRVLETGLGRTIRSFSYPNGAVDDAVARAVAEAGYRCAVGVETGPNPVEADRFRLRRYFIHEERLSGWNGKASEALLRMKLCGLSDWRVSRSRRSAGVA